MRGSRDEVAQDGKELSGGIAFLNNRTGNRD
jgi:hypothetical protein